MNSRMRTSTQTLNTLAHAEAESSFRRRVILRAAVILVLAAVLLAVFTVWIIRGYGSSVLEQSTQTALDSTAGFVQEELTSFVRELEMLSRGAALRRYAQYVNTNANAGSEFDALQADVLRQLEDIIARHSHHANSVRYVTADGRSWGEVRYADGQTLVDSNIQGTPLAFDPTMINALTIAEPGVPYLSPATLYRRDDLPHVLYIYIPIVTRGNVSNVLGVLQGALTLDMMEEQLYAALEHPLVEQPGRRILLLDAQNRVLVDTEAEETTVPPAALEKTGYVVQESIGDGLMLSSALIDNYAGLNTPWRVILIDDYGRAMQRYNNLTFFIVMIYGVMLVGVLAVLNRVLQVLTRPLNTLNVLARQLASGRPLDEEGVLGGALSDDELGEITRSLSRISYNLRDLTTTSTERIKKRTRDLEVAARIGREVAMLYDIDVLLVRAINLICEEYGFYHAQVFLIDDIGKNAVLVQSRGRAGKQLLAQNFKIPVGSESVIGRVTGFGLPVVVNDTAKGEGQHRFNPLLPETRAELGMPLLSGDKVIGVLDIQSKFPDAFRDDDIPTYTLLSDQLAVAITNARLVSQTERRIQQIDSLNRQLTREAWEEVSRRQDIDRGYRYNLVDIEAIDGEQEFPVGALSAPIRIRNEAIGEVVASPEEGQAFTMGDHAVLQAVASRVALAIENARLFQETQTSLMETSTLYQMSRYLNEANSLPEIVSAIITSVVQSATSGQIWLFDEYFEYDAPRWTSLITDWVVSEREEHNRDLEGMRLHLPDHPFLRDMDSTKVSLIANARQDARLDSGLKLILRRFNAEAAVFVPISVRGGWRGFVTLMFSSPREFSEREGRIYHALIDQAGVAIDNRLLLQQTEQEVARNENLYAASRIINTAQNMQDLVYAAVATSSNPVLDYGLALLEGRLDTQGWPTQARMVAQSRQGAVSEANFRYPILVQRESPLRRYEPEVVVDDTPNVSTTSDTINWMRRQHYRFMITFPLVAANQPIALFYITSRESIRELPASDYEVYRALAGQMSSQIQIRNLLQRTETALDEVRRLYIASNAITGAQDLEAVYKSAVEHLARPFMPVQDREVMPETVEIALLMAAPYPAADAPYLEAVYRWNSASGVSAQDSATERLAMADYPYGSLTRGISQPLYVGDLSNGAELPGASQLRQHLLAAGFISMTAAPIQLRGVWFGVVVCQSDSTGVFDEQYLRFLMALSDQIAVAVDNRRLFNEARYEAERAQQEAQRALALAEAAQLTNRLGGTTGDIARNLNQVFERVAQESGFDRWMLVLFDEERTALIPTAFRAPEARSENLPAYDMSMTLPIIEAIRFNKVLMVNDPAGYRLERGGDAAQRFARLDPFFGKHIAAPVYAGGQPFGALFMGRGLQTADIHERDTQLVETLATQVALALENRRLFLQAQNEQKTLRSILETLPAGVLVLDPETLIPLQFNEQIQNYLGREIDPSVPFSVGSYNLCRTGTTMHYPEDELPIFTALRTGQQGWKDDVAIPTLDGSIDLMVNAAPITDVEGNVTAVVAAFQDITNLRQLENTLQENLRETVALYEAQRQLTESAELEDVLDVIITQLILLQPADAYVLTRDDDDHIQVAREFIRPPENPEGLRELLKSREMVNLKDIGHAPLNDDTRALLEASGVQAILTIPLHVSIYSEPFGWMVAVSEEVSGFASEQVRILEQLGEAASTAIDNRLLIRRQRETVQEVRALYNATNAISQSRDVEQLSGVLQESIKALSPDYYAGYLFGDTGLSAQTLALFDDAKESLPIINFEALLSGYKIPPRGAYIEDLSTLVAPDAAEIELLNAGIRAMAIIALRPRDADAGFMVAAYRRPRRFSDSEDRYLNTLADGASVVFNNFILFAQIQTALEETSTLYQASRALFDAASPKDILEVIVNFFALQHIDRVFITLLESRSWDAPGATARVVAHWYKGSGASLEGATLSKDVFPAWEQLTVRDVTTIDDATTDFRLSAEERHHLESFGVRSLTVVPLRVPARTIGTIWMSSPEAHEHDPREERTYRAFSEQASLTMETEYLFQQTERRARQLQTSAQVGQAAGQILDLNVLLPRVVDLIRDAFRYDHVQVFMMDDNDEFAMLRASTGDAGQKLLAIKHRLQKGSHSVVGQVTGTGKPQIAADTADVSVVHRPNPYLPNTRSEMALPLILKDRVVGALDVQSNQPNAFTEEDVQVLTTLAAQIAVAIDNANLYEAAQEQADKMGFLFQITSSAAGAETVEEALHLVSERIYHMLEPLSVVCYLPQLYIDSHSNTFATLKPVVLVGANQPIDEIEEVRVDDKSRLLGEVYFSMQPFVIENTETEGRYLPVISSAMSAVILPLVVGSKTVGMVVIENERPSAYDYDMLQLLLTLAGSISAVVQSLQLLEQLQTTNEQLRELDRMKSAFLANMSHELRTPLNSIIGFSRVMLKGIDGELTEMQEQDLTTIYNSGQHLLMLINDVLDQAKIAANKMDLKFAYFDVKPLVEGVRSIGIGLVKDKPVNMLTEIAPNLPQAYGDEFRTRQVLINLISNAAKFTSEGSITIRVYSVTEEEATNRAMIRVDVIDTGIGIAEKDQHLLFEAFRQVDSSLTRTVGGTGLGLPIAKSLVELQGGFMTVQSEVNVGSTFSITIPVAPPTQTEESQESGDKDDMKSAMRQLAQTGLLTPMEEDDDDLDAALDGATLVEMPKKPATGALKADAQPAMSARPAAAPRMVMPDKREILLIEDNKDMVDQFRRILQREGFDVVTADHPSYAEAMVGNMQPTALVMDVNFAGGEGWNILQRLKSRDDTADIPVVVVTLNNEAQRAEALGVHSFIQRPFMPESLVDAVLRAEKESNTRRILIIDDQPDSVRLLTQMLNEHGTYRVYSATSGSDGISMVARRRPDLIILDLRMPEMDGFAVLQELRSNPEVANIPVLVVTGEVNFSADEQQMLENVHVLRKTDISQEEYDQFIRDVRKQLEANGSR